jgi:hypothetical protein
MNRLVPNRGPLMHRIDFFGAAVFVPVFLVSVGLLLDPAVMLRAETLGLAAVFVAACLGGKLLAALLTRPLLGASGPQAGIVFALTTPQAAATLASTTVGFQIGLFSEAVVNAVLVLILVTVLVSTLTAERLKARVALPPAHVPALGEHVLVAVADVDAAPLGLRLARQVAAPLAGTVEVVLLFPVSAEHRDHQPELDRLSGACRRLGIDADPVARLTDDVAQSVLHAAGEHAASLVLVVGDGPEARWAEAVSWGAVAPVAIVRGNLDRPLRVTRPVAPAPGEDGGDDVAASLAAAWPRSPERESGDAPAIVGALSEDDVAILAVSGWDRLADLQPPDGAAVVLVPAELVPPALRDGALTA